MINNIPGIEEVNMIRDDGHVIHFNNPKVQASLAANTFAITGHAETKLVTEILPQIINQLGPDSLRHLYQGGGRKDGADLNGHPDTIAEDDEDVPELVDNFDAPSKNESKVGDADDDVPALVDAPAPAAEFIPPPVVEAAPKEPSPVIEVAPKEPTPVPEVAPKEPSPVIEVAPKEPSPVVEVVPKEPSPVAEVAPKEPSPVAEVALKEPSPVAEVALKEPSPIAE